jgi:D-serine deaminase-like pyridoxal phosphate-dependent protein
MNRRNFLAASLSTGVAAAPEAASGAEVASRYRSKAELPTPALLLDLDAFESNLRTMAGHCRKAGCRFRPHAKTHKCPEIARQQVKSGAVGVCVATVPEAEVMVAAGIRGVLLTSPIVERGKVERMVDLARKSDVLLAIGDGRQVEQLNQAAGAAKVIVDVLVDVDVGDRRTGALPGKPALELARLIGKCKNLRLRGVQAYAGHASHVVDFAQRQKSSRAAMDRAVATRDLLARSGFKAEILSGGSTGTYNIDSEIAGVTELQVGSYVFMDVDYRRIGSREDRAVFDDFRPSLTVLTTVVSAAHADRVTVDAGTKALDTTVPSRPHARDRHGLLYTPGGDEFGILAAEKGTPLPRLGERLEFIVPHCDPTTNLYDRLYAVRGEKVQGVWPILARRESAVVSK